ncbi:MAG TPA: T9SS type A sorting domain-containing protein [Bacteroidales bacterium]|nr:T9SS type A sorting domain-containing protein [Bacteroidales bacterium]
MIQKIKFLLALSAALLFVNSAFSQTDTLVFWEFADSNRIADKGIPLNLNQKIKRQNGFSGTYYYDAGVTGPGLRTSAWSSGAATKFWMVGFTTKTGPGTGYVSLKLSSRQQSTNAGPRDFKVEYSLDTINWFPVPGSDTKVLNDNFVSGTVSMLPLPSACDTQPVVYLRWIMTSDSNAAGTGLTTTGYNRIDDILISGQEYPLPPETIPPSVTQIRILGPATMEVIFNEALEPLSAQEFTNYTFSEYAICNSAALIPPDTVLLQLSVPLIINIQDTLYVDNIADIAGNIMTGPQKFPVLYSIVDTLVYWNFVDSNRFADVGIPENAGKAVKRQNGFTGTYSYSSGVTGPCLSTSGWTSGAGTKYWIAEFTCKTGADEGYTDLTLFSRQKSTNAGPRDFVAEYSLDTITWHPVAGSGIQALNDNFVSGTIFCLSLPPACNKQEKVFIRWIMTSDSAAAGDTVTSGQNRIDDILITGTFAPDDIPPVVTAVSAISCDTVEVVFNELVDSSALSPATYVFSSGNNIDTVFFGQVQNTVLLVVHPALITGNTISVFISDIADINGNIMTNTLEFDVTCSGSGIDNVQDIGSLVSVFPNPFTDVVNIQVDPVCRLSPVEISVYDGLGKIIYHSEKQACDIQHSINLGECSPGVYYLLVKMDGKVAASEKLVKWDKH